MTFGVAVATGLLGADEDAAESFGTESIGKLHESKTSRVFVVDRTMQSTNCIPMKRGTTNGLSSRRMVDRRRMPNRVVDVFRWQKDGGIRLQQRHCWQQTANPIVIVQVYCCWYRCDWSCGTLLAIRSIAGGLWLRCSRRTLLAVDSRQVWKVMSDRECRSRMMCANQVIPATRLCGRCSEGLERDPATQHQHSQNDTVRVHDTVPYANSCKLRWNNLDVSRGKREQFLVYRVYFSVEAVIGESLPSVPMENIPFECGSMTNKVSPCQVRPTGFFKGSPSTSLVGLLPGGIFQTHFP